MAIPILDLQEQYRTIREEINDAIQGVLEGGDFILGPNVRALEQEVAQYCGCAHGIGVASGTDALRLAMDALEIGPGDEVITPTFTFIAPANVVSRAGATPILVDIDPRTFNLDPVEVEAAITERTKAIMPVHLYGLAADMGTLMEMAARYSLPVVEDSAQALGAEYNDQRVCSFGIMGCLSFFPTKNLGAYGDAGMVVTCDPEMADRLGVLRQHGRRARNQHQRLGYNSRLDELQAAVLRVKLRHLGTWNAKRRGIAAYYDELLAGLPVTTPYEAPEARHVYQQYTIRAPRRDELQAFLEAREISAGVFYPLPMHLQEMYADLGLERGSYPEAERAAGEVLSLPIYPELTDDQVENVAAAIREFYGVGLGQQPCLWWQPPVGGTRFLPSTRALPKEPLPLLDRLVIHHLVEEIVAAGIPSAIIVGRPDTHDLLQRYFSRDTDRDEHLKDPNKPHPLQSLYELMDRVQIMYVPQPPELPYGNGAPLLAVRDRVSA